MSRQTATVKKSNKVHSGLWEICKHAKVGTADIARAFDKSEVMIWKYLSKPHKMSVYQIITLAGLLSASPEYVVYVIRFNSHSAPEAKALKPTNHIRFNV